ncbi:MAG: hypothetical protein HY207_06695 [Nitrospirae bacterium]|nr:hypothetical protein [Nitrospirota bacterium]
MRFRLFLPSIALALTVGSPLVSVAAQGAPQLERVVIDSASSAVVSVDSSNTPLEIVLLPDPLEYRPVHPDQAVDRSEDVSLTDPETDQPSDGEADAP